MKAAIGRALAGFGLAPAGQVESITRGGASTSGRAEAATEKNPRFGRVSRKRSARRPTRASRPASRRWAGTSRIFHDIPESAAQHVRRAWDDVAGWWNQLAVQEARRTLCAICAHARQPASRAGGGTPDGACRVVRVGSETALDVQKP